MLAGDHAPISPLKHAEKDVKLAVALGRALSLGLPIAASADTAMRNAMAKGFGDNDFAATYEAQKAPPTGGGLSIGFVVALCTGSALLGALVARMKYA